MKKIAILLLLLCAGILLFSACADGGEDDGYETRTDTSGDGSPENLSGVNAKAVNLSENFTPRDNMDAVSAVSPSNASKAADFAVRLFRAENRTGSNTLVSPLSVFSALAMTANGARGETLSQIESALGMTLDECNAFFRSYANALPSGETSIKI